MVITGRADKPCLLEIDDDQVNLRDAASLWGLNTYETYCQLRPDYPEEWRTAYIGPAGENRTQSSVLACNPHRQACRGGGVMGMKDLRAIVVRSAGKKLADPDAFRAVLKSALTEMMGTTMSSGSATAARVASMPWANQEGLLPPRNFQYALRKAVRLFVYYWNERQLY